MLVLSLCAPAASLASASEILAEGEPIKGMGFGSSIRANAVPEWRDFYVDYDKLRGRMRSRELKALLAAELARVNNFYFLLEKKAVDEKNKIFDDVDVEMPEENFGELRARTENTETESEIRTGRGRRIRELRRAVSGRSGYEETGDEAMEETGDEDRSSAEFSYAARQRQSQTDFGLRRFMNMHRGISRRKKEKNITEFMHSLIKIAAYRDINASALLKLAKRHAEQRRNAAFYDEFAKKLKASYFYKSARIDLIRVAIKKLYKRIFAKNEPEKARIVFSRIKKGFKSSDWLFILSGLLLGIASTLAIVCQRFITAPRLFWGVFNIFIGFVFFGCCLKVFKGMQINYKFIFNFDICSSMNNSLYLFAVSILLFIHTAVFLLLGFFPTLFEQTVTKLMQLGLVFASILLFLSPVDAFFYNSRFYLMSVYAHVIFRPLSLVRFRHFYFTDVAQSFNFSIRQILIACGIVDHVFLSAVAVFWPTLRILQCLKRYSTSKLAFPHILNVSKFTIGILFAFSKTAEVYHQAFRPFSIFLGIINLSAGFLWDLFMDWHILRKRYLYPKAAYAFIAAFSLVARSLWVTRYLQGAEYPVIDALVELIRRFLWTLIRVEVEHLNNCDELRTRSVIYLTAGELFYKKDQEEPYPNHSETEADTETAVETEEETEDEGRFRHREETGEETEFETEDSEEKGGPVQ